MVNNVYYYNISAEGEFMIQYNKLVLLYNILRLNHLTMKISLYFNGLNAGVHV